ncbi:class I SAM-dependent methyltransferase [Solirubrobacter soli]|uniref:class I SAM-dependent methyltransferase n=1 Tax=Solirubrobacter soli TaxID=363832 RepID=UPI0003F6CD4C|nr:class I SAM-dependent methyltransferase [Solirubrobacter soli]
MTTTLHAIWSAVAPAWAEHADYADARGAEVTSRMLSLADPSPGDRVLELACGPGGAGLAAAALAGEVVLSDVSAEMAAIAGDRAAERGLTNVTTRVLDLEQIAEPDAAYDVVLCRDGLMFAFDPAGAADEIKRVLRPGGRLAIAVWGPRERNPWLGIMFDAVTAQLGHPVPPPGMPGPFALSDAGRLRSILAGSGLEDVTVAEVPVPMRAASFVAWLERTTALAGPLAGLLAALPEEAARELRGRLRDAVTPYRTGEGLVFPGVALVASGRRAS